jgi:hypothetical protein
MPQEQQARRRTDHVTEQGEVQQDGGELVHNGCPLIRVGPAGVVAVVWTQ